MSYYGHETYVFEQAMDSLQSALALPRVEPDGSSDCPFAESLFAKKEEREEEVVAQLDEIKGFLRYAHDNVREARSKLNGKWVDPSRYDDAVNGRLYHDIRDTDSYEEAKYLQALYEQKRIQNAVERANDLLSKSRNTRWPLGRPKRSYCYSA